MAKDYEQLWKTFAGETDKAQAVRSLVEILADKEGRTFISGLDSEGAGLCIETLGNGITGHNIKSAEKQIFYVALRRLTERHGLLLSCMRIEGKVDVSDGVLACGLFADLRSGMFEGRLVAVKEMRVTTQDDFVKIRKRFCKEVVLWSTLSHPNIVKLVGVQEDVKSRQFAIVSEWMSRGNIMEFVENNHDANRLELLYGAAQGLKYLHGVSLTHGDLKGANILISNHTPPRACLADFGFMTTITDTLQKSSCSAQAEGGTMVFMSPELLIPEEFGKTDALSTPQADVYAFGLVIYQVLTGEVPFRGIQQSALGYHVFRGKRPDKPRNASVIGFSDSLWSFTQRCWDGRMELRPKVGEVVTQLREAAATNWNGPVPCAQAGGVAPGFEEPESDPEEFGRFDILPLP